MSIPEPFEAALQRFDAVARELSIRYALIGGIAVILQGHARATRDVDLTVWDVDERLDEVVASLVESGFVFRVPEAIDFARQNRILLMASAEGVDFDIALGALPFEREAIENSERREISPGVSVSIARPEALLVMKVFAGRPRDVEDARRMIELFPDLDKLQVRKAVQEFSDILDRPEMVQLLDSLIGL